MNILLAPDKFKGSLSSFELCEVMKTAIQQVAADAVVHAFPMADGGDGFAAVMGYYLDTSTITCSTVNAAGKPVEAAYRLTKDNRTAIIELSAASGLALLHKEEMNPWQTSTYGTGLLLLDAIRRKVKRIILGIGGSATNDAGMGILHALGFRFLDANNKVLQPGGAALLQIRHIHFPNTAFPEITLACDVTNPFYGPQGAAQVYAAQKGASPQAILLLDEGLKQFNEVQYAYTKKDIALLAGAGAAGGTGGGLAALLQASLQPGIELVLGASNIRNAMPSADCIITGEGRLDAQSAHGKVVGAIAGLGKSFHKPVWALCGSVALSPAEMQAMGLTQAIAIMDESMRLATAMRQARALVSEKLKDWVAQNYTDTGLA